MSNVIQFPHIRRSKHEDGKDKLGRCIGGSILSFETTEEYEEYKRKSAIEDIKTNEMREEFMLKLQEVDTELINFWKERWLENGGSKEDLPYRGEIYFPKEGVRELIIPPLCGAGSVNVLVPPTVILWDREYWHHCKIYTWINNEPRIVGWEKGNSISTSDLNDFIKGDNE